MANTEDKVVVEETEGGEEPKKTTKKNKKKRAAPEASTPSSAAPPISDDLVWSMPATKEGKKEMMNEMIALLIKQGVKVDADSVDHKRSVIALFDAEKDSEEQVKAKTLVQAAGDKFGYEDGFGGERETAKKARASKELEAVVEENLPIARLFKLLSDYAFKTGDKFKGVTYKKVVTALCEHEEPVDEKIKPGKIKGLGKSSCTKIKEFFETGKMEAAEEARQFLSSC